MERKARALALRLEGKSSPLIAAELGITRETVWKLLTEALGDRAKEITERTDELRAIEHERIEGYIGQLRPMALAGDLGAHRALLRWHERLAKLLALDLEREVVQQDPTIFVVDMRTPNQRKAAAEAGQVIEIEAGDVEEIPPSPAADGANPQSPPEGPQHAQWATSEDGS